MTMNQRLERVYSSEKFACLPCIFGRFDVGEIVFRLYSPWHRLRHGMVSFRFGGVNRLCFARRTWRVQPETGAVVPLDFP